MPSRLGCSDEYFEGLIAECLAVKDYQGAAKHDADRSAARVQGAAVKRHKTCAESAQAPEGRSLTKIGGGKILSVDQDEERYATKLADLVRKRKYSEAAAL